MDRPIPDLIQWHEGLLLTPQHFQQLSSRVESLIQALPGWYVHFYWGVRRFDYDRTGLTAGVLTVRELDAVMPDGLHVSVTDRDDLQLDLRPMAGLFRQAPLPIHVAMPIANGQPTAAASHRFASYAGEPVADENTGEGGVAIPRLRPRRSPGARAAPSVRRCAPPAGPIHQLPVDRGPLRRRDVPSHRVHSADAVGDGRLAARPEMRGDVRTAQNESDRACRARDPGAAE